MGKSVSMGWVISQVLKIEVITKVMGAGVDHNQ